MYQCLVCQLPFEFSADLQNHMQRHRKADLISAVFKLPSELENYSPSESSQACISEDFCTMDEKKDYLKESIEQNADVGMDHIDCGKTREINNNLNNLRLHDKIVKLKRPQRRSCRLKDKIDLIKDHMSDSIHDSYYIPPDDEGRAKFSLFLSDDSDEDVKPVKRSKCKKVVKSEGRKKCRFEKTGFSTPKVEKEPSSETDSCSGNALSENSAERLFCSYCGSGYRTQSSLADHIRHNHFNHCNVCEMNFTDARVFREHQQRHAANDVKRLYVCGYCSEDCASREVIARHTDRHLQSAILDDVISLEQTYFSERTYMNTMYNMFNAGYMYGKRMAALGGAGSGGNATGGAPGHLPTEFYQVFLQYATGDVEHVERYGYLCRTCGFTLFDRSHYRDHMQIAHGITASDIERLLSI